MPSIKFQVLSGSRAGETFEPDADVVVLGRAEACRVSLPDSHISGEHVRVVDGTEAVWVTDLGSTNGTYLVRDDARHALQEFPDRRMMLASGDVLELGGRGAEGTRVVVLLGPDAEPGNVVAIRPLADIEGATASPERNSAALRALVAAQRGLGTSDDLSDVLAAVGDAALTLVPRATHATLVLRDDREGNDATPGYVPVVTRTRQGTAPGPIPVARSVFRKVVRERAAVLAADAPSEDFSSESMLGANIMSTIGVPLWRGDDILGVLQVDNRDAPVLFDTLDLDGLGVLAAIGSLAIGNARLIRKLRAAEEHLARENAFLKDQERARRGSVQIIGDSAAMHELMRQLDKVVDTRVTVLVEGETGTGKELVASSVHYRSKRASKMFVAQNCAALPENLLESELFGHKRGAFTGATEEKKGLFEMADGGTLFLDEVTEMPVQLQAKLLRVLQEGEIRPLGATTPKHVDVRIVAACNRDLEKEVAEGRFREDLYYRLKVFPLRIPPLRERRDDIPLLARFFLGKYEKEIGRTSEGFAQGVLEVLQSYEWPGNVRELENEVQRLVIQVDEGAFITPDLVSPRVRRIEALTEKAGVTRGALKDMVEQVEKYFILESLREHGNNKTSAAKTLGITREGLHKKLRQLKIG